MTSFPNTQKKNIASRQSFVQKSHLDKGLSQWTLCVVVDGQATGDRIGLLCMSKQSGQA